MVETQLVTHMFYSKTACEPVQKPDVEISTRFDVSI